MKASSFNIGFTFYYWYWYKDKDRFDGNSRYNTHNHGGHSPEELFISAKYVTFKQEIMNYKYISIRDYKTIVLPKLMQYLDTNKVKALTYVKGGFYDVLQGHMELHYGIHQYSRITHEHLLSLILYTDFDAHSTHFSSTFRSLHVYEPMIMLMT